MQLATQTVIVYRNPAEQYMWESGAYGYLGIAVVAMLAGLILAAKIVSKFPRKFQEAWSLFAISLGLSITFYKLIVYALTYL